MTPLQQIKQDHGSKADLIEKVVKLIESNPDESADEHARRLRNVANRKLLHLLDLGEKVEALGGREKLIKTILEVKKQPKDHEYHDSLKTRSLGQLVDLLASLQHRAAGKAKKKPRSQRPKKG